MQSDPVGEGPSGLGGQFPDPADLLCDGSGRFAPRQISVDVAGRHAEGSGGGATEVEGRPLRGRLVEYRFLNREVRAAEGDNVRLPQSGYDLEELVGAGVARFRVGEVAAAALLCAC